MNKLFTVLISLVLLNTSCTKPVTLIRPIEIAPFIQPTRADSVKVQEVTFTTFTDNALGSQIRRSELVLNDEGIYTYQGKIVVATATYECLKSNHGACTLYNFTNLPADYQYYRYYDEITVVYQGIEYEAIVADSCGACSTNYNSESKQRIDILVADHYQHSKTKGLLILD